MIDDDFQEWCESLYDEKEIDDEKIELCLTNNCEASRLFEDFLASWDYFERVQICQHTLKKLKLIFARGREREKAVLRANLIIKEIKGKLESDGPI
jgi:hypothetical protein